MQIALLLLCGILLTATVILTDKAGYFWLCISAMTVISMIAFDKIFTFFLTSFVLAFSFAEFDSEYSFYSLFLPLYAWLSLIALLIALYFKFPEFLGQKVNRPGSSFWDGFDGDG